VQQCAKKIEKGRMLLIERHSLPHGALAFGLEMVDGEYVPAIYYAVDAQQQLSDQVAMLGLYHEICHYGQYLEDRAKDKLVLDEWLSQDDIWTEAEARRNLLGELKAFEMSSIFALTHGWYNAHPSVQLYQSGGLPALADGLCSKFAHSVRYRVRIKKTSLYYSPSKEVLLEWVADYVRENSQQKGGENNG